MTAPRYANYGKLVDHAVEVSYGKLYVPGVIMGVRTDDHGCAELAVVIETGEILKVGLDDVRLPKAQSIVGARHTSTRPAAPVLPKDNVVSAPDRKLRAAATSRITFKNGSATITLNNPESVTPGTVLLCDSDNMLVAIDPKNAVALSQDAIEDSAPNFD
jgi:hypothetical protein